MHLSSHFSKNNGLEIRGNPNIIYYSTTYLRCQYQRVYSICSLFALMKSKKNKNIFKNDLTNSFYGCIMNSQAKQVTWSNHKNIFNKLRGKKDENKISRA
jgi:hypothetical protein|nr:MAG TPA: hypothetical protein [Caudoviricetes sp.]